MRTQLSLSSVGAVVNGTYANPAEVLGPHDVEYEGRKVTAVRAFLPDSRQVWVVHPAHQTALPMRRVHPAGMYEAICPWQSDEQQRRYQLRVSDNHGEMKTIEDPYAFPSLFSEYDLYLHGEGKHFRAYERLGAHLRTISGVSGVNFAVWAPNAVSVSVVGDFNHWDDRRNFLRHHCANGIWELFVPGVGPGDLYKYRIKTRDGQLLEKADPYAFGAEVPPHSASVVRDLGRYAWNDGSWLQRRRETNFLHQPISIYEVHLGSWQRSEGAWLGYRELAHRLVDYCRKMNFTHLELLPVSEHPFYGSWGYQPISYFAATGRYGGPEDLMYLVDYCHQNGVGVIVDWVPAHFPRDAHGLARFDGTSLYEHEDPRLGEHPDWGTKVFNYGRNEVRNFLIANALFWLDKYHIDGLRVDAVASMLYLDYSRKEGEWVPNEYGGNHNLQAIGLLQEFNRVTHAQFPGTVTIAEESTAWAGVSRPTDAGGLGFSMKWNMGWMNDTLRYMRREPIYRGHHQNDLTFSLLYAFTENFILPFSHDEVVHMKGSLISQMPGDLWQKFANLRLLLSYQWTHPGKKLMFMGGELAQWHEWNHEQQLQWELLQWPNHAGMQRLLADLNAVYRREPALHELEFDHAGFEWIDCNNAAESLLCYLRKAKDPQDFVVVCCNFTPVVRHNYAVGVPQGGRYQEFLNSDSQHYAGSNAGNGLGVVAEQAGSHGRPFTLRVTLPPLAAVIFKPQRQSDPARD
ncbi:MAG: 1,4-alpha-glucan branching protein GlgB [Pirellulaceae bacterium]|nr:1,4-alpha-glucan branching protein GlgB [Pirellulaceae bacterium]